MSKILVLTNHSYMLYRFRLGLLQELAKNHEVVLSMPFVGHEQDFLDAGFRCIETAVDRRGIDPVKDGKLLRFYQKLLRQERPDLVITYSIKPNIYGGLACRMAGVPYCANVQGLGTAFQKKGLACLVTAMYKIALKKARTVFFENAANAEECIRRGIVTKAKCCITGITNCKLVIKFCNISNLADYPSRSTGIVCIVPSNNLATRSLRVQHCTTIRNNRNNIRTTHVCNGNLNSACCSYCCSLATIVSLISIQICATLYIVKIESVVTCRNKLENISQCRCILELHSTGIVYIHLLTTAAV